jgi:cobalt-zinc-cadmium efflux system outer membrane protein
MTKCTRITALVVALALAFGGGRSAHAQAPTIEETGLLPTGVIATTPGSTQSLLGPAPGGGVSLGGIQPGRDEMLFGRVGVSAPRVPASITTPGGVYQGPRDTQGVVAPQPLSAPRAQFFGTLDLPKHEDEEGPSDGLTLEQAIDMFVHRNLDLQAKAFEIPQARADVITAGLRANPIFYADSQLVPYGAFSNARPGGPTQYDVNFSQPIDYSRKWRARKNYALRMLSVMEAQYQDAVRLGIQNLYTAYVDVLAARETVHCAQTSVSGLAEVLRVNRELLNESSKATAADVEQAEADLETAKLGLVDAESLLHQRKLVLGELLNLPPESAGAIEVRGGIADRALPPPGLDQLIAMALDCRPDIVAYQRGIEAAEAGVKLQLANRFSDAYLLFQPFTYQNNAPFGKESGQSWAMGITLPLPVWNRNQGNIERARYNVAQSGVQLEQMKRRVITEVRQALVEYQVTDQIVHQLKSTVVPRSRGALEKRMTLWEEGEITKFVFLDTQRKFNDTAKVYLDSLVRHRRSMLALDTIVGQRILP